MKRLINKINKVFAPENPEYPVAFMRKCDGKLIVSSEAYTAEGVRAVDYYGEFRGGYPWVDPRLEKILSKYEWDWEGPGGLVVYGRK
jgi:hypothetical protein